MEVIGWENLSDYIGKQLAAVIPIAGRHRLAFVVGKNARTLSLRIPYAGTLASLVSPYREVAYEITSVEGRRILELRTSTPELYHAFYLFAALVAEHIEERGDDVLNAIRRAQQVFGQLLTKRTLLSDERQVGLIGELCLLHAVIRDWGKKGFAAWVGPAGERHDFRFGTSEVEVKATTSAARKHRIHGAGQLEASPGRTLYVLSLQFELAGMGAGETLPGRIQRLGRLLADDLQLTTVFEGFLKRLGYQNADAELYMRRYQFRSRPVLVPVDRNCPKITGAELKKGVAPGTLSRIGGIEYEIDVGGLGYSEGSKEYGKVLKRLGPLE